MKMFFAILGILGAGFLGYLIEPHLRYGLTGMAPAGQQRKAAEPFTLPAAAARDPLTTPADDPHNPDPDQLPETDVPKNAANATPAGESGAVLPNPDQPSTGSKDSPIVTLMKQSLDGDQVREILSLDVTAWSEGGEEEIDGVKYQTGLVTYETMTIFGLKTFQAKALIQDGKIVRWIGVGTGLEIK